MSIFRAYDIRGIYQDDLTHEIAEQIGQAYATYIKGGEVAVGYDARTSSPALQKALIKGLRAGGCDVVDIGMVPTPVLYFAISHYELDGGIMITGSHNPPEYNGFKLCKGTHTLFGQEIQELKRIIDRQEFQKGKGQLRKKQVKEEYINFLAENIDLDKKLKIVVDAGNGALGDIATRLFEKMGCQITCLYCKPDGQFPNHEPDPTVDDNLKDLIQEVKKQKADLGIAYDGDCDRLGVVDENGEIVRGDQILIAFARQVLEKQPGAKIIFEVKCSQALVDDIKEHGGEPIMHRTGHSFIKKKMREENSPLAGEMSGHFFFADRYYGYDDGIYASARLVEILSHRNKNLSQLIEDAPTYHSTPEIRIHVSEKEKFSIVEEIKNKFKQDYEVIDIDGVRVQLKNGWGLVRASNTEPAIILRFEAKSQEELDEIKEMFVEELQRFPSLHKLEI